MLFEPFAQKESLKYKRYGRSPNEAEIKTHCDCLKRDIDECPKGHKMKLQMGPSDKKAYDHCDACNKKLGNLKTPKTS